MKDVFRLVGSARSLWRYYGIIGTLTALITVMNLLVPALSGWAIDEIRKGTSASMSYVVWLAVAIFVLDLLMNVTNNVIGYLGDQMAVKLNKILSARYYEHLLTLPQHYFDTELSGKIISRLNRSITQITNFLQMMSNNFLQFIFGTVFSLVVVALYSWQVALILLALYPIYIFMTFRSSSVWQKYQAEKNLHTDIGLGRFTEAVGQIKVVKSFLQERRELQFYKRHADKVIAVNQPQSKFWHVQDVRRRLVLNVIFFLVYLYIFMEGARGGFTPGQAVALILYAMQIRIPIFTISFLVENTQRAIADSRDYYEVMNIRPEIADRTDAAMLNVSAGAIAFNAVSFSYDAKQPVIQNVSLQIAAGSKVALVGESGEGKTTLTNLLLRYYEPEQGTITIDGQDIQAVTQSSLRRNIAVVFQDPALFSGTIRENIAYARPTASVKEVEAAAKAANAHEFVRKLPQGYDTEIGERGLKLSGGQKQRIAIARAILKDAPILVLDEATSSLDSKSEHMVQEALEHLMRGRTTIIVAHRLSTIQTVDTIVTLRGGTVDEVGSPTELANSGGIYDQLLALQNAKTDADKKKLRQFDIAS